MAETQLTLTTQERDCLVKLLELELKQRLVEEHRTRSPAYREHVLDEEAMVESVLRKLGHPPR